MPSRPLTETEIDQLLQQERVIRLGFTAPEETYVVPVFYVLHEGALCGLTTPGRKSRMGEANPPVAFQIDSSLTGGIFEWSSVTGEGAFEVVNDPAEFGPFAEKFNARLPDAPAWMQAELEKRFAAVGIVAWRVRPKVMTGRTHRVPAAG
jgi:nitroimidazol reductase NimA-like FMN-containing flavoprotein (pyridoxamine 5'-phosphate oxidase superfamily)